MRKFKILFLILFVLAAAGLNHNLFPSDKRGKNRGKAKTNHLEFKVVSAKIQFTRIKLKFNQPLNPDSITPNSLFLLGENGRLEHQVKLKARQEMISIKLKDRVNLLKPLILVVSPTVSSISGKKLEKGFIKLFNINIKRPPGSNQKIKKKNKHKNFFHKTIVLCRDPWIEADPGLFFLAPLGRGRILGTPARDEKKEWKRLKKHMHKLHRQKLEELEKKSKGKGKGKSKGKSKKQKKGWLTLEKILHWFHNRCHWPEIIITGISDNDLLNNDAAIQISIDDIDGDAWFYNAVLDFSPYQNGTPVTTEGSHWLLAVGVDRWYKGDVKLLRFSIDKTPPQLLSLTPSQDFTTRESQLKISGETKDAHRVTINGVQVPVVQNRFTKTVNLEPGKNNFSIVVYDLAENTVERSFTATFLVDEESPVVSTTFQDNSFLNTPVITVTGTVTDESPVKYVTVNDKLSELSGENFTCPNVQLAEGENILVIGSEDEWGNRSEKNLRLNLDTKKGEILLEQPAANAYLNTTPVVFKGEIRDDSPVTLQINGTGVTVLNNRFETTLDPGEGTTHISIILTDKANNITTEEFDIHIDITVPSLEITHPSPSAGLPYLTNRDSLTVSGTISDANSKEVTLSGAGSGELTGEIIGSNFYFKNVPLEAEGTMNFELVGKDRAGNLSRSYNFTLVRDTKIEKLTILEPANQTLTNQTSLLVRGVVVDSHLQGLKINGIVCPVEPTTHEFSQIVRLKENSNIIDISVSDLAGNRQSETLQVIVDSICPQIFVTSPQPGAILNTPTVTVSGRVDEIHLHNGVKISNQSVSLIDSEFSVDVLLKEGSNEIKVECTDTAGNYNARVIHIKLDTQPVSIISMDPPAKSIGVPLAYTVRVKFSEAIIESSLTPQSFYLQSKSNGETLAGTITYNSDGNNSYTCIFKPTSPFPGDAEIVVFLTPGITDLAGNGLTPAYTGSFFTRDRSAPSPPVLEPIKERTSLKTVTLSGTSEAEARITIAGGLSIVRTMCDAQGNFSSEVLLKPNVSNRICVYARDAARNESTPTCVTIYQEGSELVVTDALLSSTENEINVLFSRAIDISSITDETIVVSTASGIVPGTFTTADNNTRVIYSPSPGSGIDLSAQVVMLEVKTGIRDTEKIYLSFPFARVFNQKGGEIIVLGEVYDDRSGLPLGGCVVRLISLEGTPPPEPAPTAMTNSQGKYVLVLPVGQCVLRIGKENYTYSDRPVLTAPGFSTAVFDSRLAPLNSEEALLPGGGVLFSIPKAAAGQIKGTLIYPDGAVEGEKTGRITAVGVQALQGRLPAGWSPLAIMDIRIKNNNNDTVSFLKPCELRATNLWPDADNFSLILGYWDEQSYRWKTEALVSFSPEYLSAYLEKTGQYAFLLRDSAPTVPPKHVVGQAVPGITAGSIPPNSDIRTRLEYVPDKIYPGQTSAAELTIHSITGNSISSGVPVQARVTERYNLLGGSTASFEDYTADLTAYNYGGTTIKVEFNLSPNNKIKLSDIGMGTITSSLTRYSAGAPGMVMGKEGGTVTGDGGAEITIEADSVIHPLAVNLQKSDLSGISAKVAMPSGFEAIGALELSLGGSRLLKPAIISLPLSQDEINAIPAEAQLFVVKLAKTG
ncbi:MAG: Ig-like domain-containing protein, partial [bacterium]|nr:Ig-like domain-containing protein [bacterium]